MKENESDWQLRYQNSEYLEMSIKRLNQEPLIWCSQFAEIINTINEGKNQISINDIGCNVGHFCRVLKKINLTTIYTGYDISKTYINIAKDKFPNNKFYELDIANEISTSSDISVISATLEHIIDWKRALKNIFTATKETVILRSFFGKERETQYFSKKEAVDSYPILQFSFEEIAVFAEEYGFNIKYLRDLATDSIPQYLGCSITRTQYIALLQK